MVMMTTIGDDAADDDDPDENDYDNNGNTGPPVEMGLLMLKVAWAVHHQKELQQLNTARDGAA